MIENANSETANFAILFEFDGDKHKIRHVMYNCSAARPSLAGQTNEESREVQPETLSLSSRPLPNGLVKARTGSDTNTEAYSAWFTQVYLPVEKVEGT